MIEEVFLVTVDVPENIDMNSKEFEEAFIIAVDGSFDSGTQDHDWRYVHAMFNSYFEAQQCEADLKRMLKIS